MNKQEQRRMAIGAVRSEAKEKSFDLSSLSADDALRILDDIYRIDGVLVASLWYGEASDNQIKAFKREWEARKQS